MLPTPSRAYSWGGKYLRRLALKKHSRPKRLVTQQKLMVFQQINSLWGPISIDLFTSGINAQCQKYFSWFPDPQSVATDAFAQDWSQHQLCFLNPPWILIPRVLPPLEDLIIPGPSKFIPKIYQEFWLTAWLVLQSRWFIGTSMYLESGILEGKNQQELLVSLEDNYGVAGVVQGEWIPFNSPLNAFLEFLAHQFQQGKAVAH